MRRTRPGRSKYKYAVVGTMKWPGRPDASHTVLCEKLAECRKVSAKRVDTYDRVDVYAVDPDVIENTDKLHEAIVRHVSSARRRRISDD